METEYRAEKVRDCSHIDFEKEPFVFRAVTRLERDSQVGEVLAIQILEPFKVNEPWGGKFEGKPGDWLVQRSKSLWIIDQRVFTELYKVVGPRAPQKRLD